MAIGEGKTVIDGFAGCGKVIGDDNLRMVQVFEQLQQHRQRDKFEYAGLEEFHYTNQYQQIVSLLQ